MNYRSILYFLGIYTFLISVFSILNILYSIYFDFVIDLNSYLITFFKKEDLPTVFSIVFKLTPLSSAINLNFSFHFSNSRSLAWALKFIITKRKKT